MLADLPFRFSMLSDFLYIVGPCWSPFQFLMPADLSYIFSANLSPLHIFGASWSPLQIHLSNNIRWMGQGEDRMMKCVSTHHSPPWWFLSACRENILKEARAFFTVVLFGSTFTLPCHLQQRPPRPPFPLSQSFFWVVSLARPTPASNILKKSFSLCVGLPF